MRTKTCDRFYMKLDCYFDLPAALAADVY